MSLATVAFLQQLLRDEVGAALRLPETEYVAPAAAPGRVLAEDVVSALNVPGDDVSAMDGFALGAAARAGSVFALVGESAAGRPFSGSLNGGGAVRIMTGAVVPPASAAVVMQEHAELFSDSLRVLRDTPEGSHIRRAGEEIAAGDTVLRRGRVLNDADVMLLASLGLDRVGVYRKIRVAVLSSGDELADAGEAPAPGRIYDSNRPMLEARLRGLPAEVVYSGRCADTHEDVRAALQAAAACADVVITSGGVSVGDYDYLREVVGEIGEIRHYKVAMKPGKPFVFGRLGEAWYFGLPGNPVSGFVGFDMFVKAALWQLGGAAPLPQPLRFRAVLSAPVAKSPGRTDIQRAVITRQEDGGWTAEPAGAQDSHRVLGVSRANAYMILPQDSGSLHAGEEVTVQPFAGHFL